MFLPNINFAECTIADCNQCSATDICDECFDGKFFWGGACHDGQSKFRSLLNKTNQHYLSPKMLIVRFKCKSMMMIKCVDT